MDLIIDRTLADVERWRELHDKGFDNMNSAEQAEWLGFMKGRYNSADLNRVENAVKAVSARFPEVGYVSPSLVTKTNWTAKDMPTREEMARYLGNVAMLREAIPLPAHTPNAPTINQNLNFSRANDIEKILCDVDRTITGIQETWFRMGELYSGEV